MATPHAAFGELIRVSLEEIGEYKVRLVMSGAEVRASSGRGSLQLAILDSSLNDEPFVPLCMDLLDQQQGIRLVIIPPENNPNHPALGGLIPHGYLTRPFYLPDLVDTINQLLSQRSSDISASVPEPAAGTDWLPEAQPLQSSLEKALPGTQALGGIVGIYEQEAQAGRILACSGQLADEAARDIAGVVFRYWNRDERTDLMRFIRLPSEKKDYLIYATPVAGETMLMLVFEATAPLSQIRPQTKMLAQQLGTRPADAGLPEAGPPKPTQEAAPVGNTQPMHPSSPSHAPETPANTSPESSPGQLPAEDIDFLESLNGNLEEDAINLTALLGSIPTPNPGEESPGGGWITEAPDDNAAPASSWQPSQQTNAPGEPGKEDTRKTRPVRTVPAPPIGAGPAFDLNLAVEEEIDAMEDTRPHIVAALTTLSQLEPVSPAISQLSYTCLLIPRLPQHYLTGELADRLSGWVQQLCLAFGWRLEGIAIRPEYLQWTVQVSPSISPGNLVRIVRQHTSTHIFTQFPHFNNQNPSGDFWATGYLIVSGAYPPSAQLLRGYIVQTRRRQGILK